MTLFFNLYLYLFQFSFNMRVIPFVLCFLFILTGESQADTTVKIDGEESPSSNPASISETVTSETSSNDDGEHSQKDMPVQTPLYKYKQLFTQHRNTQLEAVKRIVGYDDNTRRYELVNMMLKQIFKVTEEAKQNVTIWGYLPGDPLPENITVLEGVTKIYENTALFGDMVLRLPDTVHDLYDRKKDWQLLLAWAYGFCMQSGVFEGPSMQLLNLMAQEVTIIAQDPNYFNPYKAVNKDKKKEMGEAHSEKPVKKKAKKKLQRGPRMTHSEL